MSRRKRPQKPWAEETAKLEEWLYENELYDQSAQLSPYHWRIKTIKATIDVWAGSKKFYIKGTGGSTTYQDINELKKYL